MHDDAIKPILPKAGPRRRRRLLSRLLGGLALLVVAGAVGWGAWDRGLGPRQPGATDLVVDVTVPSGASAQEIARLLEAEGLISNRALWILAASRDGYTERFQAGDYKLSPSMSGRELMEALTHGTVTTFSVTIPEGYTVAQIARKVADETGLCTATELKAIAEDPRRWPPMSIPRPPISSLEGYLFPDTYAIDRDATPEEIIGQMVSRLEAALAPHARAIADSGMTLHEILTLASIVEREMRVPEERPIGAQVFLKRLREGRRLESCATVQYVLPEPKEVLSEADTRIDSPYNTYRHEGLPPGPIANPGLPCIEAVLYPANTDYLFFRTEGSDGRHRFSRTLAEHLSGR